MLHITHKSCICISYSFYHFFYILVISPHSSGYWSSGLPQRREGYCCGACVCYKPSSSSYLIHSRCCIPFHSGAIGIYSHPISLALSLTKSLLSHLKWILVFYPPYLILPFSLISVFYSILLTFVTSSIPSLNLSLLSLVS